MNEKLMVTIDAEKLFSQMKERGLTRSKICKDVGVNSGYFANAKTRGTMSNMMAVLLESRYGILRDTYVIKEKPTVVDVVEVVSNNDFFSEENQQKLYKLMYSAMYNAMKRALEE